MVITTNIAIPELAPHESAIIVGGAFERDIWALCGDGTVQKLRDEFRERRPHWGLVGASGISISEDLTDITLYCHKAVEKDILATICEMSPRLIVAAGGDKLGKSDMVRFWNMRKRPKNTETIIVTTRPPEADRAARRRSLLDQAGQACKRLGSGFRLDVTDVE